MILAPYFEGLEEKLPPRLAKSFLLFRPGTFDEDEFF